MHSVTDPIQDAAHLFERSLDHSRSVGPPASTARALLQLAALRFLSPSELRPAVANSWSGVLESMADSVERSYPQLAGIFTDDLLTTLRNRELPLREWMSSLDNVCAAFAGDAAAFGKWFDAVTDSVVGRGVPGWQYATPRNLANLVAGLAKPQPQESVHDPCVGAGSFLAAAIAYNSNRSATLTLGGQEIDPGIATLARLRLFLLGARDVQIKVGDVLRDPLFVEAASAPSLPGQWWESGEKKLSTFDVVFCDPPYGQRLSNIDFLYSDHNDRFRHGKPSRASSDMAFLQHAIACLRSGGRALTLIAHGPLYRSGGDGDIRANMIREDLIEAVIGLPFGVLPGLSIEPALILCRRGKDATRKGRVLFIDASDMRDALSEPTAWQDFAGKILETFEKGNEVRAFSRVATLAEIETQGFSLQPRRYVARRDESSSSFDLRTALAQAREYEHEAEMHATQMDRLSTELLPPASGGEIRTTEHHGSSLTPGQRLKSLTNREREVFERIVAGRRNKQIAVELGTSENVVRAHSERVMLKMAAGSAMELMQMAGETGVAPDSAPHSNPIHAGDKLRG